MVQESPVILQKDDSDCFSFVLKKEKIKETNEKEQKTKMKKTEKEEEKNKGSRCC